MFELVRPHRRRSARRAYRSRCQAVRLEDFRLVGERILDLSPKGALVAFDDEVHVGEEILLDFRAPWLGPFVSVSGRVTRVVHGWRGGDPGYAAALAVYWLASVVPGSPFAAHGKLHLIAADHVWGLRAANAPPPERAPLCI